MLYTVTLKDDIKLYLFYYTDLSQLENNYLYSIFKFYLKKIISFQDKEARMQFIIGRYLIAKFALNKKPIDFSKLEYEKNGKPFINGKINFNLSSTMNLVVLSVSNKKKNIGVDVELVKNDDNISFMSNWTDYEAYIKCTGEGLSSEVSFENFSKKNLKGFKFTKLCVIINGQFIFLSLCIQN